MSATQMGGVPATGAASDLTLVLPGRGLPAGDGWTWIAQGWNPSRTGILAWSSSGPFMKRSSITSRASSHSSLAGAGRAGRQR